MTAGAPVPGPAGVEMGRRGKPELIPAFRAWFLARMDERGLGVNGLAADANLPASSVSRWASGKTLPDVQNARALAAYFGRPLGEVYSLIGVDPSRDSAAQHAAFEGRIVSMEAQLASVLRVLERMAEEVAGLRADLREANQAPPEADEPPRLLSRAFPRTPPESPRIPRNP